MSSRFPGRTMQIAACGITDIGKNRQRNEDAFLIDEQLNFYVVCDGMGGQAAGDVAALKATEFIAEHLRNNATVLSDVQASQQACYKLVQLAETTTIATCRQLHALASSQPQYAGMGTTMTMLIIAGNKAVMAHVGDSRLYLLRDQELHLLSSDHNMANEMLQRGILTLAEFETHPFRHYLTRSVGSGEAVEPEVLLFDILTGDTLLLCTDGLSRYIEDDREMAGLLQQDRFASIPQQLVKIANDRGGHDNITAVAIRVTSDTTTRSGDEVTRTKTAALQSLFLCETLSYPRLIRLVEISEIRTYAAGDGVLSENDVCEGLYLILDGRVAISRDDQVLKEFCAANTSAKRHLSINAERMLP